MRFVLALLLCSSLTVVAQAPDKPIPAAAGDQTKISQLVTDVARIQTALDAAQAKLSAAVFEAMARQKLSPDEYEIAVVDGQFVFVKRKPQPGR